MSWTSRGIWSMRLDEVEGVRVEMERRRTTVLSTSGISMAISSGDRCVYC